MLLLSTAIKINIRFALGPVSKTMNTVKCSNEASVACSDMTTLYVHNSTVCGST